MTKEKESIGLLKGCLILVPIIIGLSVLTLGGCLALISSVAHEEEIQKVAELERIPISNITWKDINEIYNTRSKYTDLQKKEYWKYYQGKKVQWKGRVSSISDTFGRLTIQAKLNSYTFTSDVLIRIQESERSKALNLKKGDLITFTGVLDDWGSLLPVTLNHGLIYQYQQNYNYESLPVKSDFQ